MEKYSEYLAIFTREDYVVNWQWKNDICALIYQIILLFNFLNKNINLPITPTGETLAVAEKKKQRYITTVNRKWRTSVE